ncbi:bifunctional adenosylcobinamide kinase/adenosylcobinamide-phosphate guanylyltransferase [Halomonas maura]|uniref:bifunctional adenosylcobinamide kinase/adenosylcobinamide-phosphate guanylyltransferase n=1 Tax=Halomonas maura TaxID=117606 RepID=UPI0025B55AC0|nr:bifunctional adenosylcobinamide kinase/adenosylcobinamide-phosphate guanylyltransferase [Halomonas maura]MDN3555468.1 bifunctional adenosylcobinamide kinase/adenosylcobinamide-phosphate guanylyltransferase [Halomonas maura]
MQLFIGGACAGKRDTVAARFPDAVWYRVDEAGPEGWRDHLSPAVSLVLTGWVDWLARALAEAPDDDRLRGRLADELAAIGEVERQTGGEVVLIVPEMGRGIVPMAAEDRRLRDLAGWLAQDAAAHAEAVWYVRHGLVRCLRQVKPAGHAR